MPTDEDNTNTSRPKNTFAERVERRQEQRQRFEDIENRLEVQRERHEDQIESATRREEKFSQRQERMRTNAEGKGIIDIEGNIADKERKNRVIEQSFDEIAESSEQRHSNARQGQQDAIVDNIVGEQTRRLAERNQNSDKEPGRG